MRKNGAALFILSIVSTLISRFAASFSRQKTEVIWNGDKWQTYAGLKAD